MARINMSFKEFLDKNNLSALEPIFALGMTHQGYGRLNQTPTLYGLWWNTPTLMLATLEQKPVMMVQRGGFQLLWENMITKDGLDVIYSAEVTNIRRHLGIAKSEAEEVMMISEGAKLGADGKVTHPIQVTATVDGTPQEFKADFLIIAAPIQHILPVLSDATEEEREVFSLIKPILRIVSTLYTSAVIRPDEKGTQFFPDLLAPSFEGGHRASERVTARTLAPKKAEVEGERRVAVAYQYYYYNHKSDERPCNETFLEDAEKDGHKDIEIKETCDWTNYMASFDQNHVAKRYPWKVLDMQGKNRTWYCGSSVSFESTEDVVSYNHLLFNIFNLDK